MRFEWLAKRIQSSKEIGYSNFMTTQKKGLNVSTLCILRILHLILEMIFDAPCWTSRLLLVHGSTIQYPNIPELSQITKKTKNIFDF